MGQRDWTRGSSVACRNGTPVTEQEHGVFGHLPRSVGECGTLRPRLGEHPGIDGDLPGGDVDPLAGKADHAFDQEHPRVVGVFEHDDRTPGRHFLPAPGDDPIARIEGGLHRRFDDLESSEPAGCSGGEHSEAEPGDEDGAFADIGSLRPRLYERTPVR